jgi:hypothetical protein
MKRTPDIREFQKEHLLELSDVMNYIKKGFNVEPCIPKEQVYVNTVNEPVVEVKINVDEEETKNEK